MRPGIREQKNVDSFWVDDFSYWKKKDRLKIYIGEFDSVHNQALRSCQALMNRKQPIKVAINRQPDLVKREYIIHLNIEVVPTKCVRICFLLLLMKE